MDEKRPLTRCRAGVLYRDYRYTGRVKGGFEMHYAEKQCTRRPRAAGYCLQHERIREWRGWIWDWPWPR